LAFRADDRGSNPRPSMFSSERSERENTCREGFEQTEVPAGGRVLGRVQLLDRAHSDPLIVISMSSRVSCLRVFKGMFGATTNEESRTSVDDLGNPPRSHRDHSPPQSSMRGRPTRPSHNWRATSPSGASTRSSRFTTRRRSKASLTSSRMVTLEANARESACRVPLLRLRTRRVRYRPLRDRSPRS
jgi:hypothetical protein